MIELDNGKLKTLRTDRKMTLEYVSKQTGISISRLSNYESGYNIPPGNVLLALLAFYKATNLDVQRIAATV